MDINATKQLKVSVIL